MPQDVSSATPVAQAVPSRIAHGWRVFALLLIALLIWLVAQPAQRAGLIPALVITAAFAAFARILGGVTFGGAAVGFLVTLILFVAAGPAIFGAVLLVFVLTYAATRFGRQRKRFLLIAERPGGRDAAQVLANLGFAAVAAGLANVTTLHAALLAGSIASLAEAAADTVSSEVGKAVARSARLITTGRTVPAGTDGAISIWGTVAGIIAATLVGIEAFATGILGLRLAVVAALAGAVAMFFDSLLGATLERRGRLTNNTVNLISTAIAIVIGALVAAALLSLSG
jgi:uncharacterized protein (TIGR00297 family)